MQKRIRKLLSHAQSLPKRQLATYQNRRSQTLGEAREKS
jgi:hypothetical protein